MNFLCLFHLVFQRDIWYWHFKITAGPKWVGGVGQLLAISAAGLQNGPQVEAVCPHGAKQAEDHKDF